MSGLLYFMEHYKNLSLENIIEEIDGVVYKEEWKGVVGYDGAYEISSFGRVKSLARWVCETRFARCRILKQRPNNKGYLMVCLANKDKNVLKTVHRLVAVHFVSNPNNKPTAQHRFGKKLDNRWLMLDWFTIKEQNIHALESGLRVQPKGRNHCCAKQVINIETSEKYGSIREAAAVVGFSSTWLAERLKGNVNNKTPYRYADGN